MRYFVGVNCLSIKLLIVWVDRSLICVNVVGLKHAGIDGKKLTWDLQVNSSAISVKLMWIKAEKPVEKTGKVTSQAQKKKHLSPSTRRSTNGKSVYMELLRCVHI
jgi:hypothetical protein